MRGSLVLAVNLLLVALVVVACSTSYPPCYRGEYQGCNCASGVHGYQACSVTEDGFEGCVCDGTTPGVDGGRDASGADAREASLGGPYLGPCGPGRTCTDATNVCFSFPSKGEICTKKCTMDSECTAPSPGCTPKNGVCRAP